MTTHKSARRGGSWPILVPVPVRLLVIVVGAAAVALVIGVLLLSSESPKVPAAGSTTATGPELTAYVSALRPPTASGGMIVEEEMKPSVPELRNGSVPAQTLIDRARGWQIDFATVRRQLAAVQTPPGLGSARQQFDLSLQQYIDAAAIFEHAAQANGTARAQLIDQGVAEARVADTTYDHAAMIVQAALRVAGLPPDIALPGAGTS